MNMTTYTISDMMQHPDHGVPFREKRDSFELYKIPYYEDTEGVAPAAPSFPILMSYPTGLLRS